MDNFHDFIAIREEIRRLTTANLTKTQFEYVTGSPDESHADIHAFYDDIFEKHSLEQATQEYAHNYQQTKDKYKRQDQEKEEPFQFYRPIQLGETPNNRLPAPGITQIPFKYHVEKPVYATPDLPESGFQPMKAIMEIIKTRYPKYHNYIVRYVRPLGTTDATFKDFNKEQSSTQPITEERKQHVLKHVKRYLSVKPYKPVYYASTQFAKLPVSTGTGYFNRHSYNIRSHAYYARSEIYKQKPTSKGYFFNSTFVLNGAITHHVKHHKLPFRPSKHYSQSEQEMLKKWIMTRPTMIFTRNHISERDKGLKQRPVYAVDDLFLTFEVMLTLPLLCQARKMDCCIMYGLETIRGGNHYLDHIAKQYRSYFTLDWSSFDQRLPWNIVDIYYTDFLESLIVINKDYQNTYSYPDDNDQDPIHLFNKMSKLLEFTHLWYRNMVFVTADGFAYTRTKAGVPSGQFNTQYIDSFGNLYIIIDAMIEYGFSDHQIESIRLFIMGDDNSGFTHMNIQELEDFIEWIEVYAFERWNMVLSKTKSVITSMRNKIETLSYECNFGMPIRPIGKLVAQLAYPEHGPNPAYMSYRAIGIAYAAAGMDSEFHNFCHDIYEKFKEHAKPLTEDVKRKIGKHLPGYFKILDDYFEFVNLEKFPTIHEVRNVYSEWKGPLKFTPKWDESHFSDPPDLDIPDAITIADYRKIHNIPRPSVVHLFD